MKTLSIIIFSKNRACQLELLLRSIKKLFPEHKKHIFNILYTYTNEDFKKGYKKLIKIHPEFNYICEKDSKDTFRQKVINLIDSKFPYTMFLVDDDVFKEKFSIKSKEFKLFSENKNLLCLSLRMHPKITYSYTRNMQISPPKLDENNIWNWEEIKHVSNWGYPMSLDGHIFRTNELIEVVKKIGFTNPNTFEVNLSRNPINKHYMICYNKSKIVNIPCNRVQNVYDNLCGDISAEYLNNLFLSNNILSLKGITGVNNNAPQQEIKFSFIRNSKEILKKLKAGKYSPKAKLKNTDTLKSIW